MKYQTESRPERLLKAGAIAGALAMLFASASLQAATMKPYWEFKKPKMITIDGDLSYDTNGMSPPVFGNGPYVMGFEGISQYDGASFGRNFIPPDTMGAVGRTQYMSTTNGAYAVFDKATGNRTALMSDVAVLGGRRADRCERRFAHHVQRRRQPLGRDFVRREHERPANRRVRH